MPLQREDAFFGIDNEDFIRQAEKDESHKELYLALVGVATPSTWPSRPGSFCPTVQEITKAFIYSMAIWTLAQVLLQVLVGQSCLSRCSFSSYFTFELGFILLVFVILLFGAKVMNLVSYKFFWIKRNTISHLHESALEMKRMTKMVVGGFYRDEILRNVKLPMHPTLRHTLVQNVQVVDQIANLVLRLTLLHV